MLINCSFHVSLCIASNNGSESSSLLSAFFTNKAIYGGYILKNSTDKVIDCFFKIYELGIRLQFVTL